MTRASSELAHLFRALKAPAAARALPKLADRAARRNGPTSSSPQHCFGPRPTAATATADNAASTASEGGGHRAGLLTGDGPVIDVESELAWVVLRDAHAA